MQNEQILATLHTFNNQLTSMQRQVIALITELSTPPAPATVEQHQHTAAVTPGPTTPPVEGPTAEAPTPTVETSSAFAMDSEHQKLILALQAFIGTGSLFHKYLSPEVLTNAKGFIKPGQAGLQQYQEDISVPTIDKLIKWPTGFYRNRDNKHVQFFLNLLGGLVYVDTSPEGLREPVVVLVPDQPGATKRRITDLQPAAIDAVARMVEDKLAELNDEIVRQG